jgi:cold shock protein
MLMGGMVRGSVNEMMEKIPPEMDAEPRAEETELAPITGRVKWFDATRGFGFLVSDEIEGDVLIHFSVLRDHGRRSIPEGAIIECIPVRLPRGLQVKRVLSIDLSAALPQPPRSSIPVAERADRKALADAAGGFEPVEVKWFNRVRGYGFLKRPDEAGGEDVFVHMETVRIARLPELQPGQMVQARIAPSAKGLTAVELQPSDESRD